MGQIQYGQYIIHIYATLVASNTYYKPYFPFLQLYTFLTDLSNPLRERWRRATRRNVAEMKEHEVFYKYDTSG